MRIPLLAAAALLTACSGGGTAASSRRNAAIGSSLGPALPTVEPLGWLAIAPVRAAGDDVAYWLPVDNSAALLFPSEGEADPAAGLRLRAVPVRGGPVELSVAGRKGVLYGCDENGFEAVALQSVDGAALDPGPVWILPDTATAASWDPSGLEVAVTQLDPKQRTWDVGPLKLALTAKDASHATFAISLDASWLFTREVERPVMAGADDSPIDLTLDTPGLPSVAGAFTMAPHGSILIVLATPGYEGTTLSTLLYDGISVREVEAMTRYLYACAF